MDNVLKYLIYFSLLFCLGFVKGKSTNINLSNFSFLITKAEINAELQDTVIYKATKNLKILRIKSIKNAYLINALDTNDKITYTLISVKIKKKDKKGIKIKKNNFYIFEILYYNPYQPNVIVIGDRLRYYKIHEKLIYIPNRHVIWEPVVTENLYGLYYSSPLQVSK